MVFDRGKEKKHQDSLYLNKILIERVKFTKFLGIIIDKKLTWTHDTSYTKNKISQGFGIILRARKFFNKSALLKIYDSCVLPYHIYCAEIWGNISEIHILTIITLKKEIVRAITFSPYLAHTEDLFLFCRLKIFPLKKLVIYRIGVQMFKYHKGMVPKSVCELFTLTAQIIVTIPVIKIKFVQHMENTNLCIVTLDLLVFMSGITLPVTSLSILLWLISRINQNLINLT